MKRGVHTIRSGITTVVNPTVARRYTLDNGDFELNMKLTNLEIFPIGTNPDQWDNVDSNAVFFVVSTTEAGAIPTATTVSPDEYGPTLNLRPADSQQSAWGIAAPAYGYVYTLIDPDHIIPEDVYVNAWSISSGGTIVNVTWNLGFMLKFQQMKSSGSEALLYQAKDAALD